MSDQESRKESELNNTWQEVGKQFQLLGEGLAAAFQTTIQDETTRRSMKDLQAGVEDAIQGIRSTVQKGVKELEDQNIGEQARQAADSLISAGEKTVEEVRPHLLSALQQLNHELDRLIQNIQATPPDSPGEQEKTGQ
jgi:DNA anti-recombination protein RmuC